MEGRNFVIKDGWVIVVDRSKGLHKAYRLGNDEMHFEKGELIQTNCNTFPSKAVVEILQLITPSSDAFKAG